MTTVAEAKNDLFSLLREEYEGQGVRVLITGETPENGDRFIRPRFRMQGSERLGLGSNWRRFRGSFSSDVYAKHETYGDEGPQAADDLASTLVNQLDGTLQFNYQLYFTNAFQGDVDFRDGFYRVRVEFDWRFDSEVTAGEFSPMRLSLEYGIARYTQGGTFLEAVLQGTTPTRYYRETEVRFPATTSTHRYWYFRLPNADDTYEVLNNAIGTRTEDRRWSRHENPGGVVYVVNDATYPADTIFHGIVELRPG